MAARDEFDKIELHLIRVLHTLITERSVSRAALKLHSTQPTVSAQLKRLRELTGDPLLVRAGQGMRPTAVALQLADPAARLLQEAGRLFSPLTRPAQFDPATSEALFRIAASDYLDPGFLPALVGHLKRGAPGIRLELLPLTEHHDYRRALADGSMHLVIGNWLRPPGELHLGRLIADEVVCMVSARHPMLRGGDEAWTVEQYLEAEHIAPIATYPGAPGVIDEHLAAKGWQRRIVVRATHFGLIPSMVADSLLVLTTGRRFCERYANPQTQLPVRIVRCPVAFPSMTYYQLWHDTTHAAAAMRWLREQVREVARRLVGTEPGRAMARGAD